MRANGSKKRLAAKAARVAALLEQLYPDAVCSLDYDDPFRLLVCVRLSAQCTDERVNKTAPALFERFPTPRDFADADITQLEEAIYSCGFYRSKARDIKAAAAMICDELGGVVPDDMQLLLKIPGVGRKSANLLLGDIYGRPAVVADTHCIRISARLGLSEGNDPYKTELALREILDPKTSNDFCHRLVLFGRQFCMSRNPDCSHCPLSGECEYAKKGG